MFLLTDHSNIICKLKKVRNRKVAFQRDRAQACSLGSPLSQTPETIVLATDDVDATMMCQLITCIT